MEKGDVIFAGRSLPEMIWVSTMHIIGLADRAVVAAAAEKLDCCGNKIKMEKNAMKKFWKFIKDLALYIAIQVLTAIFFIIGFFNKGQWRLFLGKTTK